MASILVACTEAPLLHYLADGLERAGHYVVRARSIDDVMDAIAEDRFELFVADIFEPIEDGVALFATLEQVCPYTRIIALSDYKTADAHAFDLSLFVESVIARPFAVDRVRTEIEWVLTQAHAQADGKPALA